jgi:hypothetical protein
MVGVRERESEQNRRVTIATRLTVSRLAGFSLVLRPGPGPDHS